MDKKSKILFLVVLVLIAWSIWATYDRIFIKGDYLISLEVPCDIFSESCFVWEEEDEEPFYYKIVAKPAYDMPNCDPAEEECLERITCEPNEKDCETTYCDPADEDCVGPITEMPESFEAPNQWEDNELPAEEEILDIL